MPKYKIKTKDIEDFIEAKDRLDSIKIFFKQVKATWPKYKTALGHIGFSYELNGNEPIPFRIVPSLFNLGLIDEDEAIANLIKLFDDKPLPRTISEYRIMLMVLADHDKWLTEAIKNGKNG